MYRSACISGHLGAIVCGCSDGGGSQAYIEPRISWNLYPHTERPGSMVRTLDREGLCKAVIFALNNGYKECYEYPSGRVG